MAGRRGLMPRDMCPCPVALVNTIVCRDGTLLTLPLTTTPEEAGQLARDHADTVLAHGGLIAHTLGCPECGRVYFHARV